MSLTIECPDCWHVSSAEQCETCEGEGSLLVYCARCCQRPAVKHQDGDATCRACEVVAVCQCGEQWCVEELVEAVNTGARTCCREMVLEVYG